MSLTNKYQYKSIQLILRVKYYSSSKDKPSSSRRNQEILIHTDVLSSARGYLSRPMIFCKRRVLLTDEKFKVKSLYKLMWMRYLRTDAQVIFSHYYVSETWHTLKVRRTLKNMHCACDFIKYIYRKSIRLFRFKLDFYEVSTTTTKSLINIKQRLIRFRSTNAFLDRVGLPVLLHKSHAEP